MCNVNFTHNNSSTEDPTTAANVTAATPSSATSDPVSGKSNTFFYAVIPAVVVLAAVGAALYYVYVQRRAASRMRGGGGGELGALGLGSAAADGEEGGLGDEHKPIRLLEIKARGRFGAVWRGELKYPDTPAKIVAVKIFPLQVRTAGVC